MAWLRQREERWIEQLTERISQHQLTEKRVSAMYTMWYDQIREEGYRGCGFINMAGEFSDEKSPVRALVRDPASFTRALIGQSEATCHRHCS